MRVSTDRALDVKRQIVQYLSLSSGIDVKAIEWENKLSFAIEARTPDIPTISTRESKEKEQRSGNGLEPELMWVMAVVRAFAPYQLTYAAAIVRST